MDPAVLRPGRFGKVLYVPLPLADERVAIMKAHARKKPIDADVDLDALARTERCSNLTGADLASLVFYPSLTLCGLLILTSLVDSNVSCRLSSFLYPIDLIQLYADLLVIPLCHHLVYV
jgi:hypothetical protein